MIAGRQLFRESISQSRIPTSVIAAIGLMLALLFALTFLNLYGGVTGLLHVPSDRPETVAFLEDLVGPVSTGPVHDGHYFFLLALDPLLLNASDYVELLDVPDYRAQRILYPMLAGGFGLLGPRQTLWGLVVVNVLALAAGTWATSKLTVLMGGSPILGLAFVFNPGLFFELAINGSSVVGFGFAVAALVSTSRSRWTLAATLFAASVLARETMFLVAVGTFLYAWNCKHQRRWRLILVPGVIALTWAGWVRISLGGISDTKSSLFDEPFSGLLLAVPSWLEQGGSTLFLGLLTVCCAIVTFVVAIRRPNSLAWAAAPFAPLLLFLNPFVLEEGANVTRSVAPLITAGIVLAFSPRRTALDCAKRPANDEGAARSEQG